MTQGRAKIAFSPAIAARRGLSPALGKGVVPLPTGDAPPQPEGHARTGRRNDPCACGSGKKLKRCCMRKGGAK